ncbi:MULTISPECIES: hypothetical protein [unclassified Streptomyces]|nr:MULTISPECIES: hypothetical protein [unclassified Streptomyces]
MNADDEQLLCGRVYGCDYDDPGPGPLPQERPPARSVARRV